MTSPLIRTVSRREVLALGLTAAGAALGRRFGAIPESTLPDDAHLATASEPGLVIRNPRPLDAESPPEALRTLETPIERFFVRSHHGPPKNVPAAWTLTIDGDVARPVTVTAEELRRMPKVSRLVTIECAGNGRGRFALPSTSGVQWGLGAVGTATWTGVSLVFLLERAGLKAAARHLWMEAADHAPFSTVPKFLRSIPRDVALGDALVAYEMNQQPIPLLHGGPLRLVVPGWYGMASTKWLTHVHARPSESDNFFMARGYRYGEGNPVRLMRVKSLVTSPLDGERVRVGPVRVTGAAWTGTGTVQQVELSADGGRTWVPADFSSAERSGAWRLWHGEVLIPAAGEQTVRARAIDSAGNAQPEHAAPNPGGYGNNSIHEVRFRAAQA
jgi:sulfite oxidase